MVVAALHSPTNPPPSLVQTLIQTPHSENAMYLQHAQLVNCYNSGGRGVDDGGGGAAGGAHVPRGGGARIRTSINNNSINIATMLYTIIGTKIITPSCPDTSSHRQARGRGAARLPLATRSAGAIAVGGGPGLQLRVRGGRQRSDNRNTCRPKHQPTKTPAAKLSNSRQPKHQPLQTPAATFSQSNTRTPTT